MLINGSLISLGDIQIRRHVSTGPGKADEVTTTYVIRLQVYRELQLDWASFCAAPIKGILNAVPQLQLCDGEGCGIHCKRCHAPVETPCTQVLLEVWARRFHTLEGKTVPGHDAGGFAAFLRIAAPAREALMKVSIDGVYFEPRAEFPPGPDRSFAVVWLPQLTRQEVIHKLRTTQGAVALVRLKSKYGLRVASKDEESVHTKLRPNVTFHKMTISKTFVVQPLPHGITRAAVDDVLQAWGWQARPLQPTRGNVQGAAWLVGTEVDPAPVLVAFGKDVIVNPAQQRGLKEKQMPAVQASKKTQKHIWNQAASSSQPRALPQDPWQQGADPWASYVAADSAGKVEKSAAGQKQIDQVADKLRGEMKAATQAEFENQQC